MRLGTEVARRLKRTARLGSPAGSSAYVTPCVPVPTGFRVMRRVRGPATLVSRSSTAARTSACQSGVGKRHWVGGEGGHAAARAGKLLSAAADSVAGRALGPARISAQSTVAAGMPAHLAPRRRVDAYRCTRRRKADPHHRQLRTRCIGLRGFAGRLRHQAISRQKLADEPSRRSSGATAQGTADHRRAGDGPALRWRGHDRRAAGRPGAAGRSGFF